jgi:hypothetical protein
MATHSSDQSATSCTPTVAGQHGNGVADSLPSGSGNLDVQLGRRRLPVANPLCTRTPSGFPDQLPLSLAPKTTLSVRLSQEVKNANDRFDVPSQSCLPTVERVSREWYMISCDFSCIIGAPRPSSPTAVWSVVIRSIGVPLRPLRWFQ